MAWATGTITDATPTGNLSAAIQSCFGYALGTGSDNTRNWSFIETIPAGTGAGQSGSGSFTVDVFKCAGSGTDANSAGIDFFIGLGIPVTDGAVASSVLLAEMYLDIAGNPADADRGKFKRPCAGGSASALSTVPTGAGYWITDTYGTWNSYATANIRQATPTLNTTGFTYYIKVTNDTLTFATAVGATSAAMVFGLCDSLTAVSDPMPLFQMSNTVNGGGFSRLPSVVTSGVAGMWFVNSSSWTQTHGSNAANVNDIWQNNKVMVARLLITSKCATGSYYLVGGYRGLMKADYLYFDSGGTVALGDTVVISGVTWTVISTNNNNPAGIIITRAT